MQTLGHFMWGTWAPMDFGVHGDHATHPPQILWMAVWQSSKHTACWTPQNSCLQDKTSGFSLTLSQGIGLTGKQLSEQPLSHAHTEHQKLSLWWCLIGQEQAWKRTPSQDHQLVSYQAGEQASQSCSTSGRHLILLKTPFLLEDNECCLNFSVFQYSLTAT